MIQKFLIRLLLRLVVGGVKYTEVEAHEREKAYADLYQNLEMMKVLNKMLMEDTKEMMKRDWYKRDTANMRAGAFVRTRAIVEKAREMYEKQQKQVTNKNA